MSSECQTVWIQIRPDIMSGLIWVQTICKGYQQMTLGNKGLTSTWYAFMLSSATDSCPFCIREHNLLNYVTWPRFELANPLFWQSKEVWLQTDLLLAGQCEPAFSMITVYIINPMTLSIQIQSFEDKYDKQYERFSIKVFIHWWMAMVI